MTLSRQKDIALLLLKHGRKDLLDASGIDERILNEPLPGEEPRVDGDPAELAEDLEELGPTFIKLGQLLASREDLLPRAYTEALSRLQDDVEPFPAEEARELLEAELGVRIARGFESFEDEPIAAASLGQVHRARLRDGRDVVVKVQRPGIRDQIRDDLQALESVSDSIERHTELGKRLALGDVYDQFRRTLLRELDFRREADNLRRMGEILASFDRIVVPSPVDGYTTSRILTMDFISGTGIEHLNPAVLLGIDRAGLAEDLQRAYLDQILVHGFFHADPHPGNVLLTRDGNLALVDLGMVARFDQRQRRELLKLLLALSEGDGAVVAERARRLTVPLAGADEAAFERAVSDLVLQHHGRPVAELATGQIVLAVVRAAVENGFQAPPELSTLGKTLSHLDEIVRCLDPTSEPDHIVRDHAQSLMQRSLLETASPGNLFSMALEANELARELPGRLNSLLEQLDEGRLGIRVDAIDEVALTASLRSIANRVTLGLILAGLIVGAALIMRIETGFTVLGYPGVAMIFFLIAAVLGIGLVITIARRDYWPRDR